MAKVANTRKSFNFKIEVDGVDQFEVQKVDIPEVELDSVEHGDINYSVKTAGRVKVGDLVLEKIKPIPGSDSWAWDWLRSAQSQLAGGGLLPLAYKRILTIKEMDTTGLITLNRYICTGCWVKKVKTSTLDRTSSDNLIETITLSVDTIEKL